MCLLRESGLAVGAGATRNAVLIGQGSTTGVANLVRFERTSAQGGSPGLDAALKCPELAIWEAPRVRRRILALQIRFSLARQRDRGAESTNQRSRCNDLEELPCGRHEAF